MPEDEAWASLRLCQQPLAAAGNAGTPRRPAGVTKAPALGGRGFGAVAVTEWRCETTTPSPRAGHCLAPPTGRAHGCCRHPALRIAGRELGADPPAVSGSGAYTTPDKG